MEKRLGKIKDVRFGLGGYEDACLGIHFTEVEFHDNVLISWRILEEVL